MWFKMSSKLAVPLEDDDAGKGPVRMEGFLKKLKTMKKKYFVLRGESTEASARLEYYDSEKKYTSGHNPKRAISLKTCFNINRKTDTKHKHVIALYTKDDVFSIVLESEAQLEEWLKVLLELQSGEDHVDGEPLRPIFEHVWKVKLQGKGLGDTKELIGPYYVCLSDQTLSLVKCTSSSGKQKGVSIIRRRADQWSKAAHRRRFLAQQETLEFPLNQVRSCGGTDTYFYIDVGRQSITGAGELWMITGDINIAANMNSVILNAFYGKGEDELDGHRKRSASATEANRPRGLLQRRATNLAGKPVFFSTYSGPLSEEEQYSNGPKICIAPPPPPSTRHYYAVPAPVSSQHVRNPFLPVPRPDSMRRHSVSAVSSSSVLNHQVPQQPTVTQNVAPAAPSTAVSHQRTKSCPVSDTSSAPAIVEPPKRVMSQSHVAAPEGGRRGSGGSGMRRPLLGKSTTGPRERCDSMPSSRQRTISEGTHKTYSRPQSVHTRGMSYSPPGPCSADSLGSAGSCQSIDETDSERFPHGTAPDESVILEESLDEAQQWPNDPELEAERMDVYSPLVRPPASLSLPIHSAQRKISVPGALHGSPSATGVSDYMQMSPKDIQRSRLGSSPAKADYLTKSPGERSVTSSVTSDYLPMSPVDTNRRGTAATSPASDYMAMSPPEPKKAALPGKSPALGSDYMAMSPPEPKKAVLPGKSPAVVSDYMAMSPPEPKKTSGTSAAAESDYLAMSPPEPKKTALTANSPLVGDDYMAMSPPANNTRCGQSSSMDYLPMSPADLQRGSSRASALTEDGYVPMAPAHSDDGYVDMDPVPAHRLLREDHHSDMSPGSSCSVTSGTPSTDHFYLAKVTACFTTSDEEDASSVGRPTRTYSFGSQPKAKLDVSSSAEAARVRAFSVGTRPTQTHKLPSRVAPPGAKCSSAPMLSGSWSGASRHNSNDPMGDHMEMDFSNSKRRGSWRKGVGLIESSVAGNSSADSGYMDMSSKSPPKPSTKHLFSPPDGKSIGARLPKASNAAPSLKTVDECPKVIKPQMFPTSSAYAGASLKYPHADLAYMDMTGKTGKIDKNETRAEPFMDIAFGGSGVRYGSLIPRKSSVEGDNYMPMTGGKSSSLPIDIAIRNSSSASRSQSTSTTSLLSSFRKTQKKRTRKKAERRGSKENVTTPTAIFPMSLNSPTSDDESVVVPPAEHAVSDVTSSLSRVLRVRKENSPVNEDAACFPTEEGDYALMKPGQHFTPKWTKDSEESRLRLSSSGIPPLSPRSLDQKSDSDGAVRLAPLAKPENSRLRTENEPHPGVIRQVSTSSSSSTELMSVKEGAEQTITYASLDLSESEEPRSPRPSPSPASAPGPSTYAEIDFNKSESRRNPQFVNKNIRH